MVDCQTVASKMTDCNTNGMNFNEGNNEQPCVPDAHGFSSLTVNSSQKRQEVEEMVFSERYFETRGPTAQRTTSKIITSHGTIQERHHKLQSRRGLFSRYEGRCMLEHGAK